MTNEQLYMTIGIPLVFNALMFLVLNFRIGTVESAVNARMTSLETTMHKLLESHSKAWEANLRRVEEVMDARLKHIEDELAKR